MPSQINIQGRIVWGHPAKLSPKKDNQKKDIIKDGQKVMQCAFGVAIDRNTFYQTVLPVLLTEARVAFPQANFDGRQFTGVPPKFAWKYKDGDIDIDDKGKPYSQREGYAGHCVLTVSTQGFAPAIYKSDNGQPYRQMAENEIKCGDFVGVNITTKYNGSIGTNTPGLYVNPNGVIHLAYMPEIVTGGQDPDEMFAGFQAQLPPGASATPLMSSAPMPGGMHAAASAAPVAGYPAAPAAAPVAMPYTPPTPVAAGYPAAPAQLPPPAHDFVQNAVGGAPPAPPAPPAVPAAPVAFPPAGWIAHPTPGYFYMGNEVLTEAQLRARVTPPAAPGYPGQPAGR